MTIYSMGGVELPGDMFFLLSDGPGPNDTMEDYDRAEAEYQRLKAIYEENVTYELVAQTHMVQVTPAPITGEPKYSETQRFVEVYDHNNCKIDSKKAENPDHELELISELQQQYKISEDDTYIGNYCWINGKWVRPFTEIFNKDGLD